MTTVTKANETNEVLKTLREKAKADAVALKATRATIKELMAKAKTEKTANREVRIAERKAKLMAELKKLETVGKGAAKAKAVARKPGAVTIIKPAE